jgi:(p)ppGpp synthase/HD superfamily hydrolase
MATLERAIALAARMHEGQSDKAGSPYILHPIRMMMRMTTPVEMMAAVLHDVVEDTSTTLDDLRREGFSEEVVQAVDSLSRRPGETYDAFVERVAANPTALRVKLADLADNMDLTRLGELRQKDLDRLLRYHASWKRLRRAAPVE